MSKVDMSKVAVAKAPTGNANVVQTKAFQIGKAEGRKGWINLLKKLGQDRYAELEKSFMHDWANHAFGLMVDTITLNEEREAVVIVEFATEEVVAYVSNTDKYDGTADDMYALLQTGETPVYSFDLKAEYKPASANRPAIAENAPDALDN